ncbi:MAG: hypothetical protein QOG00_1137 [Pyrinomonadaceae bacterium]|nr:hypothetical protein [Pyrinomonadaceae bacterium]
MADTKLKVTFIDIEVVLDGDPIDKGEIYWSLKVDGSAVTSRSVDNPYKIGSGGTITLGQNATVTKSGQVGTNIIVSGSISEKDSGLSGKDESASFTHNYTAGNNWGTGNPHAVPLSDKNLSVVLNYLVERV